MPEFRQNKATKEWVIIAPERGKRPSDFVKDSPPQKPAPSYEKDCPFCPGNEHLTLTPLYSQPADTNWQVRVVANKFAALQSDLDVQRRQVGSFLTSGGFGIAEVVIEHPRHDYTLAMMNTAEIAEVLRAYRERQIEISRNDRINLVTIFRNHGARAGTSLRHPHSQIIATPIVPPHVRYPMEQAVSYYDEYGKCVYCEMVNEEIKQGDRIITESKNFVAFCPFAARSPFECRIYPKKHKASYILIENDELKELAEILRDTLKRIHIGLNNPDYNYIIRSAPIGDHDTRYLHWYMVIIPKISTPAGFEIGSGIYINTTSPEDAAEFLREVEI